MIILEHLGNTDLNGTLVKPRPYYLAQCEVCSKHLNVREDAIKLDKPCRACQRNLSNKLRVETILQNGIKECSNCHQHLQLTKFGIKTNQLSGYRSTCKVCEALLYREVKCKYSERTKDTKKVYDAARRSTPEVRLRSNELARRWVAANKENRLVISKNYKHKRREIERTSELTSKELSAWADLQLKHCSYCWVDCKNDYHIDHVEPLSKGGKHSLSNLTISCPSCNIRKSSRQLVYWLATN